MFLLIPFLSGRKLNDSSFSLCTKGEVAALSNPKNLYLKETTTTRVAPFRTERVTT